MSFKSENRSKIGQSPISRIKTNKEINKNIVKKLQLNYFGINYLAFGPFLCSKTHKSYKKFDSYASAYALKKDLAKLKFFNTFAKSRMSKQNSKAILFLSTFVSTFLKSLDGHLNSNKSSYNSQSHYFCSNYKTKYLVLFALSAPPIKQNIRYRATPDLANNLIGSSTPKGYICGSFLSAMVTALPLPWIDAKSYIIGLEAKNSSFRLHQPIAKKTFLAYWLLPVIGLFSILYKVTLGSADSMQSFNVSLYFSDQQKIANMASIHHFLRAEPLNIIPKKAYSVINLYNKSIVSNTSFDSFLATPDLACIVGKAPIHDSLNNLALSTFFDLGQRPTQTNANVYSIDQLFLSTRGGAPLKTAKESSYFFFYRPINQMVYKKIKGALPLRTTTDLQAPLKKKAKLFFFEFRAEPLQISGISKISKKVSKADLDLPIFNKKTIQAYKKSSFYNFYIKAFTGSALKKFSYKGSALKINYGRADGLCLGLTKNCGRNPNIEFILRAEPLIKTDKRITAAKPFLSSNVSKPTAYIQTTPVNNLKNFLKKKEIFFNKLFLDNLIQKLNWQLYSNAKGINSKLDHFPIIDPNTVKKSQTLNRISLHFIEKPQNYLLALKEAEPIGSAIISFANIIKSFGYVALSPIKLQPKSPSINKATKPTALNDFSESTIKMAEPINTAIDPTQSSIGKSHFFNFQKRTKTHSQKSKNSYARAFKSIYQSTFHFLTLTEKICNYEKQSLLALQDIQNQKKNKPSFEKRLIFESNFLRASKKVAIIGGAYNSYLFEPLNPIVTGSFFTKPASISNYHIGQKLLHKNILRAEPLIDLFKGGTLKASFNNLQIGLRLCPKKGLSPLSLKNTVSHTHGSTSSSIVSAIGEKTTLFTADNDSFDFGQYFNNYINYLRYKLSKLVKSTFPITKKNKVLATLGPSLQTYNTTQLLQNYLPYPFKAVGLNRPRIRLYIDKNQNISKKKRLTIADKVKTVLLHKKFLKKAYGFQNKFSYTIQSQKNLDSIINNISSGVALKKKAKAKRQRLESRQQKKRKRFYPRPIWLRLRLGVNFFKNKVFGSFYRPEAYKNQSAMGPCLKSTGKICLRASKKVAIIGGAYNSYLFEPLKQRTNIVIRNNINFYDDKNYYTLNNYIQSLSNKKLLNLTSNTIQQNGHKSTKKISQKKVTKKKSGGALILPLKQVLAYTKFFLRAEPLSHAYYKPTSFRVLNKFDKKRHSIILRAEPLIKESKISNYQKVTTYNNILYNQLLSSKKIKQLYNRNLKLSAEPIIEPIQTPLAYVEDSLKQPVIVSTNADTLKLSEIAKTKYASMGLNYESLPVKITTKKAFYRLMANELDTRNTLISASTVGLNTNQLTSIKNQASYASFENQSANNPQKKEINNNILRDFWIWLYNITSTTHLNKQLVIYRLMPILNSSVSRSDNLTAQHAFKGSALKKMPKNTPEDNDQNSSYLQDTFFDVSAIDSNQSSKQVGFLPQSLVANKKSLKRSLWSLNKTNLFFSKAITTKRLNTWSIQKLRNQSKNNKTKYLEKLIRKKIDLLLLPTLNTNFFELSIVSKKKPIIHGNGFAVTIADKKVFSSASRLGLPLNLSKSLGLYKKNILRAESLISQKIHQKEKKLAYLTSIYWPKAHKLPTVDFWPSSKMEWWSSFKVQNTIGQSIADNILLSDSQKIRPEAYYTKYAKLANLGINKKKLESVEYKPFPKMNKANLYIQDIGYGIDKGQSPLGKAEAMDKENNIQPLRGPLNRTFVGLIKGSALIMFHFCALITLISISQVRCFLKFHLILLHKLTNFYVLLANLGFAQMTHFKGGALNFIHGIDKGQSPLGKADTIADNLQRITQTLGVYKLAAPFASKSIKPKKYIKKSNYLFYIGYGNGFAVTIDKANFFLRLASPQNTTFFKSILSFIGSAQGAQKSSILRAPPLIATFLKPLLYKKNRLKFRKRSLYYDKIFYKATTWPTKMKAAFLNFNKSYSTRSFLDWNLFGVWLTSKPNLNNNSVKNRHIKSQNPKMVITRKSFNIFLNTYFRKDSFTTIIVSAEIPKMKKGLSQKIFYWKNKTWLNFAFLTTNTATTIKKEFYNAGFKLVDTFEYFLRQIYGFFEKPTELTMDWVAYAFLVEWSSDLLTLTPENVEKKNWLTFSKVARQSKSLASTLQGLIGYGVFFSAPPKGQSPFYIIDKNIGRSPNPIIQVSIIAWSFILGQMIYKRILYLNDLFLEILNRPDTDLINRQKKGTLFWDIWSDILIKAADKYNINIPSLSNIKEEQNVLIDRFLADNNILVKNPIINKQNISAFVATKGIKSLAVSAFQKRKKSSVLRAEPLIATFLKAIQKSNFQISANRPEAYFQKLSQKAFFFFLRAEPLNTSPNSPKKDINSKFASRLGSEYITYQSKETDLFIDYHLPKSLNHISSIQYYSIVQQPIGTLVCQIFSGQLTKQIAKNVLVIGSTLGANIDTAFDRMQKTLLIQALAGETEIQIITDNASRYAIVNRGFAVGIKLLKEVFEAIALNTPCLFLLEDIHLIGERRPLLISDHGDTVGEEMNKSVEISFGSQSNGEAVHEKNQVYYQLSRHGITHYKKPFKGDFSLSIPTNHFAFDLFCYFSKRFSNYSSTPTHPLSYGFNSLEKTNLSNNFSSASAMQVSADEGQSDLTSNLSSIQKIISQRSQKSVANFKTTKYLSSYLQISMGRTDQLISPPSTSPFSVLLLKDQKQFKPKKIVKELPWVGLPSEQLSILPRVSYSVRAKVAALADLGFSNMSAKLDMITDLLVIIDSVRGNRGFVVFATTHLPQILDPALRRPGRLDETISIPTLTNLWNRWEFTKASNAKNHFKGGALNRLLQYSYANYISNTILGYTGTIDNLDFLNLDFIPNPNTNIISPIVTNFKNKTILRAEPLMASKNPIWSIGGSLQKSSFLAKPSRSFNKAGLALTSFLKSKVKLGTKIGHIAYYQMGKKILTSSPSAKASGFVLSAEPKGQSPFSGRSPVIVDIDLIQFNPVYNNINTYDSTNTLTESSLFLSNELQYKSLYASTNIINQTLLGLLSGKLSELFAFKTIPCMFVRRSLKPKKQNPAESKAMVTATLKKIQKESYPIYKPFFYKPIKKNDLDTINIKGGALNSTKKKNIINSFIKANFISLYGIDPTWRAVTSLTLSFVKKRYLYNKNLIVPKLLNFLDYSALEEPPSPPSGKSNILIPAKRYENYKKVTKENIYGPANYKAYSSLILDKLEAHSKQAYIKSIYKKTKYLDDPNNQNNKVLLRAEPLNGFLNPEDFKKELASIETNQNSLKQITSANGYYQPKIYKRHRNYLTNQWWNGQLTEHSAESLFLSDIDWRLTFSNIIKDNNPFKGGALKGSTLLSTKDILIDFPDADQHYNPKHRRWMLTSGYISSWFSFDKKGAEPLKTTPPKIIGFADNCILDCFINSYILLDKNRELLDYSVTKFIKTGLIKEIHFTSFIKKFS